MLLCTIDYLYNINAYDTTKLFSITIIYSHKVIFYILYINVISYNKIK